AYREAGRDHLVEEVMEEIRAVSVARVRAQVLALEQAEQYEAALEAVRRASEELAGLEDWAAEIERLTEASQVQADYRSASQAVKAGDRDTAIPLLAGIVASAPRYKDTARLLYEAVSGESVADLKAEARAQKEQASRSARRVVWGVVATG